MLTARQNTKLFNAVAFHFLFFISAKIIAQPGGGGGLVIGGYYDKYHNKIDVLKDTNFKWRLFVLKDSHANGKITSEISSTGTYPPGEPPFFLPPFPLYNYHIIDNLSERLLLVYKRDSMLIDFIGISQPNGAGGKDYLNSITIKQGYFIGRGYQFNMEFRDNKIDMSFLSSQNLPAEWYLNKGISSQSNDSAIKYINHALNMGLDSNLKAEAYSTLYIKCSYHSPYKNERTAGFYMKKLIEMTPLITSFKDRINLNVLVNDTNPKELECLNKWVETWFTEQGLRGTPYYQYDKLWWQGMRALFRLKFLHDFKGAVADMNNIVTTLQNKDYLEFIAMVPVFYFIGISEYGRGMKKQAYYLWNKIEENEDVNFYSNVVTDFEQNQDCLIPDVNIDTLIKNNPSDAEIHILRAYSLCCHSHYWFKPQYSLYDLNKAEELGITDYRINYYRASLQYYKWLYLELNYKKTPEIADEMVDIRDSARNQIDIAIKKSPEMFELYYLRKSIIELVYNNEQERWKEDLDMYNTLKDKWRFKK